MRSVTLAALLLGLTVSATAQDSVPGGTLPGGANSVSEAHGDWTVSCRMEDAGKLCVMSQALADAETGARVLAMELATPTIETADGMLLLPFGLRLSDGVRLAVDENALGTQRPYLTCIASGCLVPVVFDNVQLSALRSGQQLTITGTSADAGQPVEMMVSLAGFSTAANRSVELSQ